MLLKIRPGVPMTMNPEDRSSFDEWMKRVDALVQHAAGISVYDLPDCLYRDWYEDRLRPIRAAARALRRAGADAY